MLKYKSLLFGLLASSTFLSAQTIKCKLKIKRGLEVCGPVIFKDLGTGVVKATDGLLSIGLVKGENLSNNSVGMDKIIDLSITNDKIATH